MRDVVVHTIRSKDDFLAWGEELLEHKNEVLRSLRHEGVEAESAHVFSNDGKDYLVFVSDSKNKPLPADLNLEINVRHQELLRRLSEEKFKTEQAYYFATKWVALNFFTVAIAIVAFAIGYFLS